MTDVSKTLRDGNNVPFQGQFSEVTLGSELVSIPYSKDVDRPALLAAVAAPLAAGEAHVGQVGGKTIVSAVALATASFATPYVSGDLIGGKIEFASMARLVGLTGLVQDVTISSKSAQTFACDLVLFHTDPAATTFTDNAPFVLNLATDWNKVATVIHISDWTALGGVSFAQAVNLARAYKVATGATSLFGALVARAGLTLTSATDLQIAAKALVD